MAKAEKNKKVDEVKISREDSIALAKQEHPEASEIPVIPGKPEEITETKDEKASSPEIKQTTEVGPLPKADVFDDSHPAYEEIKVILSQYNHRHGSKLGLNGKVLIGTKGFHDVQGLLEDIQQWYPEADISVGEGDTFEIVFPKE